MISKYNVCLAVFMKINIPALLSGVTRYISVVIAFNTVSSFELNKVLISVV